MTKTIFFGPEGGGGLAPNSPNGKYASASHASGSTSSLPSRSRCLPQHTVQQQGLLGYRRDPVALAAALVGILLKSCMVLFVVITNRCILQ